VVVFIRMAYDPLRTHSILHHPGRLFSRTPVSFNACLDDVYAIREENLMKRSPKLICLLAFVCFVVNIHFDHRAATISGQAAGGQEGAGKQSLPGNGLR
jgi:hypothetical protein